MSTVLDRPVVSETAARPFALVRHSLALARRSLIKTLRTPEQLLDVTLQPVIFLVVFVYLLGGAVAGSTQDYLQVLLPAIMVQTTMFGGMATGVNLNTDIRKGVFDRFRSLPIGRSAPLIGSVLGDLIRYVVAVVSLLVFGSLMGFEFGTGFMPTLLGCLLVILFAFSVSWAFVLVGMLVREPGAVQGIAFVALFPLTFGTNMMAPTSTLPSWLRTWVEINPVTHVMDAARGLMIGGPAAGAVAWTLLWSAIFVTIFAPLAVRAYRRRA
ncbi:MAG: ABC transporter permease [Saccharothrix sp.]|nr:ABC transporter permease [Saccharothrix sp.]